MQITECDARLTIRVDADACPVNVRQILEKIARQFHLELVYYIDDCHELYPEYGQVRQVGKSRDAVDLALVNQTQSREIVVTQDYGLAALVLAKKAAAIHPGGMIYTDLNIDRLLMERHLSARARQAGERFHHARKRQKSDNLHFDQQLKLLIDAKLSSL